MPPSCQVPGATPEKLIRLTFSVPILINMVDLEEVEPAAMVGAAAEVSLEVPEVLVKHVMGMEVFPITILTLLFRFSMLALNCHPREI